MAASVSAMIMDPINRFAKQTYQPIETAIRNTPILGTAYNVAKSTFEQTAGVGAYSQAVPVQGIYNSNSLDPMLNTIGRHADAASNNLTNLQKQLEAAGENPPPGLLAKIQIATSIYNTWMSALTNMADAKKKAPEEIARNLRG